MKVYLDTCVISALVKEDIHDQEFDALKNILVLHGENKISLVTSEIAREELDKIPDEYKSKHLIIYNLLRNIPVLNYISIKVIRIGFPLKQNEEFKELISILKDENDAKHIYQCFRNKVNFFVTVDVKTILKKKDNISEVCNVGVYLPSEFYNIAK